MPAVAKYALTYLLVQAEFGLCCPVSMTDSLARTLRRYGEPALVERCLPLLTSLDFDALHLPPPTYAYDFPGGAGRYVQGASGYDYTIVNGQVFMDHGQHTGAFAGTVLKNSAALDSL
jgi:hypothetical protein